MRLFLSSDTVIGKNKDEFLKLVGKSDRQIKIALIQNAADNYPLDHREWVDDSYKLLSKISSAICIIDLRKYINNSDKIEKLLADADVIWVGGGNTYYLRWLTARSGFDKIVKQLVDDGKVYGGDSAGAIIAGPTIDCFQGADDPSEAPQIILQGFGLTDIVVAPHSDHEKYASIMKQAGKNLELRGYEVVYIKEDEALIIDGDTVRTI